jgi:uncharacterized protein (DUF2267 family)
MPVPPAYYKASEQFENFMLDARDASGLKTTNMAWNMVVGVLQAFRRRLCLADAILFTNVLPPGIRTLFVADWDPQQITVSFTEPLLLDEIRAVRTAHNFSPENALEAVAIALWRNVDAQAMTQVLKQLPSGALEFWQLSAEVQERFQPERQLLIRCTEPPETLLHESLYREQKPL